MELNFLNIFAKTTADPKRYMIPLGSLSLEVGQVVNV